MGEMFERILRVQSAIKTLSTVWEAGLEKRKFVRKTF